MATLHQFMMLLQAYFPEQMLFMHTLTILSVLASQWAFLHLHHAQKLLSNRGNQSGWLTSVRDIVQSTIRDWKQFYGGEEQPFNAPTIAEENFLVSRVEDMAVYLDWDLDDLVDVDLEPALRFSTAPILCTTEVHCIFCSEPNQPQKLSWSRTKYETVMLITANYTMVTAYLSIAHCSKCSADYYPNCITRHHESLPHQQFLIYDAKFLHISKPAKLWAAREFAVSQQHLLSKHMSWTSFADWYNCSHTPVHKLTAKQSHRLFVEHAVRSISTAYNLDEIFHCRANPTTEDLTCAALDWFCKDNILPGGHEHTCNKCTHEKHPRRPNPANAQPNLGQFAVAEVDPINIDLQNLGAKEVFDQVQFALMSTEFVTQDNLGNNLEEVPEGNENNAQNDTDTGGNILEGIVRAAVMDGIMMGHKVLSLSSVHSTIVNF
jgi:hypothetical protein